MGAGVGLVVAFGRSLGRDAGVIGVGERVVASCGSGDLWCPYEGVASSNVGR